MSLQDQYQKRKAELLNSKNVCQENKTLFSKFFDWEENKLKRSNGIREIDDRSYKTLIMYHHYFKNLNKWFKGKAWKKLTKADIKKVYDDLEDGKIKKSNGEPLKDRISYYNKVFKSKPFQMARKKDIAEEIIEFTAPVEENVRFITEEDFKKIVSVAHSTSHKLMLWLLWDIGENIGSILDFRKKDFIKQLNKSNKEPEYLVVLNKEILKRSRTPRTEPTHYKETVQFLDILLNDLKHDDKLFNFGMRQAEKVFKRAVKITKIKTKPKGEIPTLKDLRSGMACHLLSQCSWTSDEVKGRLGHKPSSKAIDKYVTYYALNKNDPKKKIFDTNLTKLEDEIEEMKEREKLKDRRIEHLYKVLDVLENKEKIKKGG
jgi:integrase